MKRETIELIVVLAVLVIVFIVLNKVFKGIDSGLKAAGKITDNFGLTESEAASELKKLDCWKPNYYKGKSGAKLLTAKQADQLAKQIYDARSFMLYYDDNVLLAVIRQLKAWTQLSFIADRFYITYQTDMQNYFWQYLEDRHKQQIYNELITMPKK